MKEYRNYLKYIMANGVDKTDRTGTGTRSVFGYQMRFDLAEGFPLLTTKRLHTKSIIHELLWFLSGSTNIKYLVDNDVSIWTDWPLEKYNAFRAKQGLKPYTRTVFEMAIRSDCKFADKWGELGPVYGRNWRSWPIGDGSSVLDQIKQVIEQIKTNPDSRRLIVSAWNPATIEEALLPPCHVMFQFYAANGKLSCQLYQRSADSFLGVPFNIASYALLTMMIAQVCDLVPGEFIWTGGDCHIYSNHFVQVEELISRRVRPLPQMIIDPYVRDIDNFKYEHFDLVGYKPYPSIKAPVSV